MQKILILCILVFLCGCSVPQKVRTVSHGAVQKNPTVQDVTVTEPFDAPQTSDKPFVAPATTPQEAIEYFARLLDVNFDDIHYERFRLATLDGEQYTAQRTEYPRRNYAVLNEMFSDWELYNPADGIEESVAFYLKDNVVCEKHMLLNDPENAWENLDATYNLSIMCGENPLTREQLFSENALAARDCFDTKVRMIEQSDEMQPYIQKMEDMRNFDTEDPGFVSFVITREDTDEYADYFVLTEYHREPDGSIRELPTRRFRFDHNSSVPLIYDPVQDVYTEMQYSEYGVVEMFGQQCKEETLQRTLDQQQYAS